MRGVRVLLAVVLLVLVGMFIFNYTSTGKVSTLIAPDSECKGVDGVSGKILILEESRKFEGLKAESEADVAAWKVQQTDECERQLNLFGEKKGKVSNECRKVGGCATVDNSKSFNCRDYLSEYQNCEIIDETEFRATWECTIKRVEIDLGIFTCEEVTAPNPFGIEE